MILLEAALLEGQEERCYRGGRGWVDWAGVGEGVQRVREGYGGFGGMLGLLLEGEEGRRPDWRFLEERCMEGNRDG